MIPDEDKAEALRLVTKAIHLIKKDGWCQKQFHSSEGQHCIVGAIYFNEPFDRRSGKLIRDIEIMLGDLTNSDPISFNDAKGRTVDEVLDLLHRAQLQLKAM